LQWKLGEEHEWVRMPARALDTASSRIKVLSERYDLIILPLSIPNAGSLHFAELVHRFCFGTKLVLLTQSEVSADILVPLFDGVIYMLKFVGSVDTYIKNILATDSIRLGSVTEIESAISKVMDNAQVFVSGRHHKVEREYVPKSLQKYREMSQVNSATEWRHLRIPRHTKNGYECYRQVVTEVHYAAADEDYYVSLSKRLRDIELDNLIKISSVRRLEGASDWINALVGSRPWPEMVVSLISPTYLGDRDGWNEQGLYWFGQEVRVIPVIIKSASWQRTWFKGADWSRGVTPLPKTGMPVSDWQNADAAWTEVSEGIRALAIEAQQF
jgi:hypothetical protein